MTRTLLTYLLVCVTISAPVHSFAGVPTADSLANPANPNFASPKPLNLDAIKRELVLPQHLAEAGVQGDVVVEVFIGEDGLYRHHRVVQAAHPALARLVEAHIAHLRFAPAVANFQPVATKVLVPFRFSLR